MQRMLAFDSNPTQVVTVKLGGTLVISSDGSGIVNGIATCDPTGGSGSTWTSDEYTHYQDRYSQVRCVGIFMNFTSNLPFDGKESSTTSYAPIVIAPNLVSQSAPVAYDSVVDNYGQKTWNVGADTSKSGITIHLSHDLKTLGWLPTGNPSAVTGPYAGCPGGVGWYGSDFPTSIQIGRVTIRGIYQFRSKT